MSRQGRYKTVRDNLQVKEVRPGDDSDRFIICYNPGQAERDAAIRAKLIAQLEELISGTDQLATTERAKLEGTLSAPRGAVVYGWRWKTSISSPPQRWGEAGGSLSRGSPVRTGAASTKLRRLGTAGWAGRGERDGKVYARNRCRYAS